MLINQSYLGSKSQVQIRAVNNSTEEKSARSKVEELAETSDVDDMESFKKDLLKEISSIYKNADPKFNNSLQISDEALEKMKNDPEFKKEMINSIKDDLKKLNDISYNAYNSIKIDENGFSSSRVSEYISDTDEEKAVKKENFELTTKDAFFVKFAEKPTDFDQILEQNKYEKDIWEQKSVYSRTKQTSNIGKITGRHYQPNTHSIHDAIANNLKGKTSI